MGKLKLIEGEQVLPVEKAVADMQPREMFYDDNGELCMRLDHDDPNVVHMITGRLLMFYNTYPLVEAALRHWKAKS